jgi:cytochrome c-type biogenesis protein CcmH/NrfG
MNQAEQNPVNAVKRETVILIGLCCLVVGFVAGIAFSIFKGGDSGGPAVTQGQQQGGGQSKLTAEIAQQILQMEMEVQRNPENLEAWTTLGHLYFDSDQPDKAIAAYDKSLAIEPNNADVLTDQGVMYRRAGNPIKAMELFDRAVAVNPNHEIARFNKGIVLLYDLKDKEDAVAVWQELLRLNPMATAPNGQLVSDILAELEANR